jgi:hypothetical protein
MRITLRAHIVFSDLITLIIVSEKLQIIKFVIMQFSQASCH